MKRYPDVESLHSKQLLLSEKSESLSNYHLLLVKPGFHTTPFID